MGRCFCVKFNGYFHGKKIRKCTLRLDESKTAQEVTDLNHIFIFDVRVLSVNLNMIEGVVESYKIF